jgi:hypothetical protein
MVALERLHRKIEKLTRQGGEARISNDVDKKLTGRSTKILILHVFITTIGRR